MSPRPPRVLKSARPGLQLPHLVDGLFHVKRSSPSLHHSTPEFRLPVRYFPTNRAGATSTGDGNIPYHWDDPLSPCEKAPRRRRSPMRPLLGHDAAVLFLRGSLPPCFSPGRFGGSVFKTPMATAAVSRTLLLDIHDPPPSASRTALPCGPRSSELLTAPPPFLSAYPVKPCGV
jgi:hypothetical protein